MKKKLELKKQVLASLSAEDQKNIIGGQADTTWKTIPSVDPDVKCDASADRTCASDPCTLGCAALED